MPVKILSEPQITAIETATLERNAKIKANNDKLYMTDVRIQQVALTVFSLTTGSSGSLLFIAACYINLFTLMTPIAVTLCAASVASYVYGYSLDDFQLNSVLEDLRTEIHMTIDTMQTIDASGDSEETMADRATLKTELKNTLGMLVERFGWENMLTYGLPDPMHLRKLMILMGKHLDLSSMVEAWKGYNTALMEVRDQYGATHIYPYERAVPHVREFSHLWKPELIEAVATGTYHLEELVALGIISGEEGETIQGLLERFREARAEYNESTLEYRVAYEQLIAEPKAKRDAMVQAANNEFNNHAVHVQIAKLRQEETSELLKLIQEQAEHAQIAKLNKRIAAAEAVAEAYQGNQAFQALVEFEKGQQEYVAQVVTDGFEASKAGIASRCRMQRRRLTRQRTSLLNQRDRKIKQAEKVFKKATDELTAEYHSHVQTPLALFRTVKAGINMDLAEFNAGRPTVLAT